MYVGCDTDAPSRRQVRALVEEQAPREEVVATLGAGAMVYSPRDPTWAALQGFLAREPRAEYQPVREAVQQNRPIVYHTTMWTQTWVFLDDRNRAAGYWFNTQ
jgi:hypothetical protein